MASDRVLSVLTSRRNVWRGLLRSLVERVFATHPELPQGNLAMERIVPSFERQMPGLIARDHSIFRVRRGPFERWVIRNARRFVWTRNEQKRHDEWVRRVDEDYWHDLNRDFNDLFEERAAERR